MRKPKAYLLGVTIEDGEEKICRIKGIPMDVANNIRLHDRGGGFFKEHKDPKPQDVIKYMEVFTRYMSSLIPKYIEVKVFPALRSWDKRLTVRYSTTFPKQEKKPPIGKDLDDRYDFLIREE